MNKSEDVGKKIEIEEITKPARVPQVMTLHGASILKEVLKVKRAFIPSSRGNYDYSYKTVQLVVFDRQSQTEVIGYVVVVHDNHEDATWVVTRPAGDNEIP